VLCDDFCVSFEVTIMVISVYIGYYLLFIHFLHLHNHDICVLNMK